MVQFELSKDSDNNIIHITDAIKGKKYYCLNEGCKSEFIVKKGDINAHHFAHKTSNFDHQGETIEHYNAKWQIFAILNSNKAKVSYMCPICTKKHFIHLSEWYDQIHIEKPFFDKKYRPDIALTKNNKLNAVIEIIYKHDLDFNAEKLLKKNQIPCFKYLISQNSSIELTKLYRNSLSNNTNDIVLFDLNQDTFLNSDTTNCPYDMGRSYDCNRDLQPRNEFPAFNMGVGYNCNLKLNPKEYMGRFYNCNHNLQPNFYKIEDYNCNFNLQPPGTYGNFISLHPDKQHLILIRLYHTARHNTQHTLFDLEFWDMPMKERAKTFILVYNKLSPAKQQYIKEWVLYYKFDFPIPDMLIP